MKMPDQITTKGGTKGFTKERSKDGNHPRYRLAAAMRQKPQVVCMKRSAVPYIATLFSVLLALVALIVCWGLIGRDHFAAIRSGHGPTWYQDLGGDAVTEIQDQDVFYHNI